MVKALLDGGEDEKGEVKKSARKKELVKNPMESRATLKLAVERESTVFYLQSLRCI